MTLQTRVPPSTEHQLLLKMNSEVDTYAVCLGHVYIAVCVIIHLLVNTTDRLVAENFILIVAKLLIDATKIYWRIKVI